MDIDETAYMELPGILSGAKLVDSYSTQRTTYRERNAYACCWNFGDRRCRPFFTPLDMVQDNTRNRVQNILSIILLITFVLQFNNFLTLYIPVLPSDTLADSIASSFATWAINIAIALGATLVGIPILLGTSTSQHFYMTPVSFFFTIGLIAILCYFLYVESFKKVTDLSKATFILAAIIYAILMLANLIYSFISLIRMNKTKTTSFYDTKLEVYRKHVKVLLTSLKKGVVTSRLKRMWLMDKIAQSIRDCCFCCQSDNKPEESSAIQDTFEDIFAEEGFFFPQRLLFAFYTSSFIMFLCFVIYIQYAVTLEDKIRQLIFPPEHNITVEFPVLLQIENLTLYNSTFHRQFYMQFQFIKYTNRVVASVSKNLKDAMIVAAVFATFICLVNWIFTFSTFRRKLMNYRRGKYNSNKVVKTLYSASHYFGFQISATFIGWIILFFCLVISFLFFAAALKFEAIGLFVQKLLIPSICTYIAISIPLGLIDSHVITKKSGQELTSNFSFYIFDLFYMALQTVRGFFGAILRAAYLLGVIVFQIARADIYLLPGQAKLFDTLSNAYLGMLYMEHYYNNPVHMVFRQALLTGVEEYKGLTTQEKKKIEIQMKLRLIHLLAKNKSLRFQRRRYLAELFARKENYVQSVMSALSSQKQE